MYKTHHIRTTFGSSDVEKVQAVVAPSAFQSQNGESTAHSHHFWTFHPTTLPDADHNNNNNKKKSKNENNY
jgi:hypothetical protein